MKSNRLIAGPYSSAHNCSRRIKKSECLRVLLHAILNQSYVIVSAFHAPELQLADDSLKVPH